MVELGGLRLMVWGLVLVLVDVRVNGLDWIPDPLGWFLALAALLGLVGRDVAFGYAAAAAGLGLVCSLPDWVGAVTGPWLLGLSVALTGIVVAVCTALIRVGSSQAGAAYAVRGWEVGLSVLLVILLLLAQDEPTVGFLALVVGLADLVVLVVFLVVAHRATTTPPPTSRISPGTPA